MYHVLFVCTGNICRSPMAHGLMEHHVKALDPAVGVTVDSAATHGYRLNEPPDTFAITVAGQHGLDIGTLRSRLISREDFFSADIIAAMDQQNILALHAMAPPSQAHKIKHLLDFAGQAKGREISDPFGAPMSEYQTAFDLIDEGVTGLLESLRERLAPISADGK